MSPRGRGSKVWKSSSNASGSKPKVGCTKLVAGFSWGAALPRVTGQIDHLGRPVVRLECPAVEDGFLAVVDTGFNGELMLEFDVAASLGFAIGGVRSSVRVAGATQREVREARGMIMWLGLERRVEVLVAATPGSRPGPEEPIALIGTRLLTPHLLMVDFSTGIVEIESQ